MGNDGHVQRYRAPHPNHRLKKVREYLCQRMGVMENTEKDGVSGEMSRSVAVVPIRTAQPNKKATIEMQLGDLQDKFNESPTAEQLKVVLRILPDANQPERRTSRL